MGGPDISRFNDILAEELNVEVLKTEADLDSFQKIVLEPNRKVLGAKCRSDLPSVLAQLDLANPEELLLEIEAGIAALGGYEITMDDIEIRRAEKKGLPLRPFHSKRMFPSSLICIQTRFFCPRVACGKRYYSQNPSQAQGNGPPSGVFNQSVSMGRGNESGRRRLGARSDRD